MLTPTLGDPMTASRRRLLLLLAGLLFASGPPEANAATAGAFNCPTGCAGNVVLYGWMACHFVGVCGGDGNAYGLYNCGVGNQWLPCTLF